jgi:hypothetical protein
MNNGERGSNESDYFPLEETVTHEHTVSCCRPRKYPAEEKFWRENNWRRKNSAGKELVEKKNGGEKNRVDFYQEPIL